MPNFVAKELAQLKFPLQVNECEFLWQASELKNNIKTENKLVCALCRGEKFLLSIKKNANGFVVKGDKITKPSNISHLHSALNAFKDTFAINISSNATSKTQAKILPFVISADELVRNFENFSKNFNKIKLEIGFGNAKHLLYRAQNESSTLLIGVEIYRAGIVKASKQASKLGLKNVLFIHADAREIFERLENDLFDTIYMHFPVPWNESPTRRAINFSVINEVKRILKNGGKFELRSDDEKFFNDSLQLFLQMKNANLQVLKNRQIDIISKYEARWQAQNKDIFDIIYTCYKNKNDEKTMKNFDFSFENVAKIAQIKENFKSGVEKFDDYFLRLHSLYEDEEALLLKASMGSFFVPCSVFVLINKEGASYIITPPATKANLTAHKRLKEFISCQI